MFAVGIDLGTTNSAVAILKGRPSIVEDAVGNRTVPSAVGWDPDLDTLIVGVDAKNSPDIYNTVLSVKRKMGTDERIAVGPHRWLPEEVSAEILKVLKGQVEEKSGEEVTDAIITVPAYFQMAAKAATKRAGELAGLKVQQLLEEPSAAIMAYGPQDDEKILVYDLGGGTFDVTLIDCFAGALTTKAVFGNNFLGGDDFDGRLVEHFCELIKKQHGVRVDPAQDVAARSILRKEAERVKIRLSSRPAERVNIPKVVESNGRPIGLEAVVKVEDFNAMIRDLVTGTLVEVEKALKQAEYDKSDVNTVLLVGGSTYVPLVQSTVKQFFGKEPSKKVNPDLAVALGAAASLILETPPEGGRHVVTVGYIPERTPEERIEVRGRTTPGSQVRVTGGLDAVGVAAGDDGEYAVDVPLKKGMNSLVVTTVAPGGRRATIEPEPIIMDPAAVATVEPPPPPAPMLTHALSISCLLAIGPGRIIEDSAAVIIAPQTELPREARSDQFGTTVDNQQELLGVLLEGDLPIAALNTKLAEIRLQLPPNVPANERVTVNFTVDENSTLTAELECANRHGSVVVNLKSPAQQLHIFSQLDNLFTRAGNRIRPEERAALEQSRVAVEDLAREFKRLKEQGTDADAIWGCHLRFKTEAERLRSRIDESTRKYA